MAQMGKPKLTWQMKDWAYCKWCEGYTQQQIADALNVNVSTVKRFLRHMTRIRPELKYKEG